ncbi:unnamed protein product [Pieris brassicae]|uniref:Uncharacterized protein n=1 Tax=Pieris brassicae TaxID=7116 RepID=A0A9P0SUH9_PIEBR|nr:unnamed protein product [Pieris brassicae]
MVDVSIDKETGACTNDVSISSRCVLELAEHTVLSSSESLDEEDEKIKQKIKQQIFALNALLLRLRSHHQNLSIRYQMAHNLGHFHTPHRQQKGLHLTQE